MAASRLNDSRRAAAALRRAVIDIGSDTVHLIVGAVQDGPDGQRVVHDVSHRSVLLELGRGVALEGRIDPDHLVGLDATVLKFVKLARKEAGHLVMVATEASRRAENGPAVLARLSEKAGEPIRVLSGTREAQLGFCGVLESLKPSGCQLVIDSGGASTEVSISQGREYVSGVSLPVGAASLSASFQGDPPSPLSWALSGIKVGEVIGRLPALQPRHAWATGGSAHHLVGLESVEHDRKPARLHMTDLDSLSRELLKHSSSKLGERRGEDPRRVALLASGALILAAILEHYHIRACTVLPAGLREGILLASAANPLNWWQEGAPGC